MRIQRLSLGFWISVALAIVWFIGSYLSTDGVCECIITDRELFGRVLVLATSFPIGWIAWFFEEELGALDALVFFGILSGMNLLFVGYLTSFALRSLFKTVRQRVLKGNRAEPAGDGKPDPVSS